MFFSSLSFGRWVSPLWQKAGAKASAETKHFLPIHACRPKLRRRRRQLPIRRRIDLFRRPKKETSEAM